MKIKSLGRSNTQSVEGRGYGKLLLSLIASLLSMTGASAAYAQAGATCSYTETWTTSSPNGNDKTHTVTVTPPCGAVGYTEPSGGKMNIPSCYKAVASAVSCVVGATDDAHWISQGTSAYIAPGMIPANMPSPGTSYATIDANFPTVILWDFQHNAGINTQITNMPDVWLANLSHDYYVRTNGNITPLMNVAAQVLSAANLARWAAAFGAAATSQAVTEYAPAAVKAAYSQTSAYPMIQRSQVHYHSLGLNSSTLNGLPTMPNPAWNVGLDEVWMEFYCVGTGTTYTEAAIMMAYWAKPVLGVLAAGYGAGTIAYNWGEAIQPGFWADVLESMSLGLLDPESPVPTTLTTPNGDGYVDDPGFYDLYNWSIDCSLVGC